MTKASLSVSLIVAALILGSVVFLGYEIYTPPSNNNESTIVSIEPGTSLSGMGKILEQTHVVRSSMFFSIYARFSGKSVKLRAGDYIMPLNLTIPEVVNRLVKGEGSSNDISVTIPEGYNNTQIFTALRSAGVAVEITDVEAVFSKGFVGDKTDWIYDGKPAEADLTGYLFPDTYKFFGNSTATQVAEKMVDNLRNKLTDTMKQEALASQYSFYEILKLASIVEKEVSGAEEQKVVAGIFLHRLADHYPLESDATLNFITGKKDTTPSASDVSVDSPYNSYAHAGLPPTPICNPGITAIAAVLEPTESDYYFFLTTPEGKALYSQTYDQHLQKKAQYYP